MPPPRERKPQRLTGTAAREIVRRGTGGEHRATVLLVARGQRLILQRRGGNPFDDARTRRLAGHRVRVTGYHLGDIFRFTEAEILDD